MRRLVLSAIGVTALAGIAIGFPGEDGPSYLQQRVKKDSVQFPQKSTGQRVELLEGSANGSNKVTISASDNLASDHTVTVVDGGVQFDGVTIGTGTGLPVQTGNSGKYLKTDGSNASWTNPFANISTSGTVKVATQPAGTSSSLAASTAFVAASKNFLDPVSTDYTLVQAGNGKPWYNTAANEFRVYINGSKVALSTTAVLEAMLGIDPTSKAFGNVSVNTEVSQTFTLTNLGTAKATGIAPSIVGDTPGFRIYSSNIAFGNISSGLSKTFKVGFKPTDAQSYTGTLRVAATGIANIDTALSGTGLSPVSYVFSENFDLAGYQNTWTEALGGGTIDEDNTSSPLEGTQSLYGAGPASGTATTTTANFTATGDAWVYFQFKPSVEQTGGIAGLWKLRQASTGNVAYINYDASLHKMALYVFGGPGAYSSTVFSMGTTYHIWVHYVKGTGNNAQAHLYVSTNGIKPGSPEASNTNGTTTADAINMQFIWTNGATYRVDKIRVDDVEIGSNPS